MRVNESFSKRSKSRSLLSVQEIGRPLKLSPSSVIPKLEISSFELYKLYERGLQSRSFPSNFPSNENKEYLQIGYDDRIITLNGTNKKSVTTNKTNGTVRIITSRSKNFKINDKERCVEIMEQVRSKNDKDSITMLILKYHSCIENDERKVYFISELLIPKIQFEIRKVKMYNGFLKDKLFSFLLQSLKKDYFGYLTLEPSNISSGRKIKLLILNNNENDALKHYDIIGVWVKGMIDNVESCVNRSMAHKLMEIMYKYVNVMRSISVRGKQNFVTDFFLLNFPKSSGKFDLFRVNMTDKKSSKKMTKKGLLVFDRYIDQREIKIGGFGRKSGEKEVIKFMAEKKKQIVIDGNRLFQRIKKVRNSSRLYNTPSLKRNKNDVKITHNRTSIGISNSNPSTARKNNQNHNRSFGVRYRSTSLLRDRPMNDMSHNIMETSLIENRKEVEREREAFLKKIQKMMEKMDDNMKNLQENMEEKMKNEIKRVEGLVYERDNYIKNEMGSLKREIQSINENSSSNVNEIKKFVSLSIEKLISFVNKPNLVIENENKENENDNKSEFEYDHLVVNKNEPIDEMEEEPNNKLEEEVEEKMFSNILKSNINISMKSKNRNDIVNDVVNEMEQESMIDMDERSMISNTDSILTNDSFLSESTKDFFKKYPNLALK